MLTLNYEHIKVAGPVMYPVSESWDVYPPLAQAISAGLKPVITPPPSDKWVLRDGSKGRRDDEKGREEVIFRIKSFYCIG